MFVIRRRGIRRIAVWLIAVSLVCSTFAPAGYAATTATTTKTVKLTTQNATGKANRLLGVVMRTQPKSSAKQVVRIPNNADVTIIRMHFTTKKKYSRSKRWDYVQYKNFKGYVPVTQIDNVHYKYQEVQAKNKLYYYKGAGTSMKIAGSLKKGATLRLCLLAKDYNTSKVWYRFRIGNKYYFVKATDLVLTKKVTVSTNTSTGESTSANSSESSETTDSNATDSSSVNTKMLQSNAKPLAMTMPSTTLTTWYNALIKVADQIEKNNLKYNSKNGGGKTYSAGLKNKKVNCATYISWAIQEADFESSGFYFYLGNGKIYEQSMPKNYFIKSPEYLVQTGLNKSVADLVSKGYLKPGDIVGKQSGYHTMVYKHCKNGKYYFFSVGPTSVANKTIRENTYSGSYKIGVIIRKVS